MHHIDRRTPWDEIWEAFESQVRSGKVDYIGSSPASADRYGAFGIIRYDLSEAASAILPDAV